MAQTYTLVKLPVSAAVLREVHQKLKDAGYDHVFSGSGSTADINMNGIQLVLEEQS